MSLNDETKETNNLTHCTECNGTGNASIERDTAFIPCAFCNDGLIELRNVAKETEQAFIDKWISIMKAEGLSYDDMIRVFQLAGEKLQQNKALGGLHKTHNK